MVRCLLFCLLGLLGSAGAYAQTSEIRGFLYDAASGEPLLYTPVFLVGTSYGAVTDVNGYFSLNRIPPGDYTLRATSLGYDTLTEAVSVTAGQILTRKLYLNEQVQELQTVEVRSTRIPKESVVNASVTTITPQQIKLLPSVGGAPDVAQYLQTIPGVIFTGDQGGQLYIRGGTPVQSLFLLDGMIIYNPLHSIGLFSVFDTDILKSVDVYTGGFGAEYGARTSAVVDLHTADGNKNRLTGQLGANPFTAKLTLEGPLKKADANGTAITFLLSGRTSYLNRTSTTLYDYAQTSNAVQSNAGLPYQFNDFYGKVTLSGAGGSKLSLFGFNFNDRADLGYPFSFGWDSWGAGSNFLLLFNGSSVVMEGRFAYSQYQIGLTEATAAPRESSIGSFNGGLDFTYYLGKSDLKYGFGVIGNNTSFTSAGTPTQRQLLYDLKAFNTELFGYARYRIVHPRFVLEPGFRVHYYASLNQISPEPRLGAKFNLTDRVRLKAATGLYSQNLIATQSDRDVVNLFTGFVSSPDRIAGADGQTVSDRLQRAFHLVTGVEWDLNDDLELNVEPYLKQFGQVINVNRERLRSSDPEFIVEQGLARGVDVSLRYVQGSLLLQGTYSLAEVTRQYDTREGLPLTYYPNFDRRHNVNLLGVLSFGARQDWEVSARWNLGSGFPFTQTQGFYENLSFGNDLSVDLSQLNGNLGILYTSDFDPTLLNAGRLPYYHRLDLSLKKTFTLNRYSKFEINAGVTNAYNRKNLFYFDRVNYQRVNQLPILPTLGVNWSF
ncbi:TonB-dependent Receptor Plug Domain [Catalinimonas alkaloidigena]|uniref:TonB-dependent Receptor Plug Domain n=1 Tax=Catalinimonas alkaloidigena TaxID=1075417 RepID=A0A1G9S2C6_9BACT|nr:TonB-dependent receptor [Catalinimonas alkaloidigena]SDM29718.1 TonB-dependent Receptor Plug Domain [Catalinimonas alkaloidigena]